MPESFPQVQRLDARVLSECLSAYVVHLSSAGLPDLKHAKCCTLAYLPQDKFFSRGLNRNAPGVMDG